MEHNQGLKDFPLPLRIIILINALCFLFGGITHCVHIWIGGLFPYNSVPFVFNAFLTSLAIIDFIICALFIKRTIWGFILSLIVITIDLPSNVYLCHYYWKDCHVWSNSGILLLMSYALLLGISVIYFIVHLTNNQVAIPD